MVSEGSDCQLSRPQEALKQQHGFPVEDLDLTKELPSLHDKLPDRSALLDMAFAVLTREEVEAIKPAHVNVSSSATEWIIWSET